MFTNIPQSQKEFYAMEEKFIARIAGSIRERLGAF
jgi:hypothetical protein